MSDLSFNKIFKYFIIGSILILIVLFSPQLINYQKAINEFTSEDFELAKIDFENLDGYGKSEEYLEIIYGIELFNDEEYDRSLEILSSYEETYPMLESYLKECEIGIRYKNALNAFENEDFSLAYELFSTTRRYKDTEKYISIAQKETYYIDAISLFENGEFLESAKLFRKVDQSKDIDIYLNGLYIYAIGLIFIGEENEAMAILNEIDFYDITKELNSDLVYQNAIALYEKEEFYEAYKIFSLLGDYEQSEAYAYQCIQTPKSSLQKIIYENEDYTFGDAYFNLYNDNFNYDIFVHFYQGDILVKSVFLVPYQNHTITMPAGDFEIIFAMGENWFGPIDNFGVTTDYFQVFYRGGDSIITLEKGEKETLNFDNLFINSSVLEVKFVNENEFVKKSYLIE